MALQDFVEEVQALGRDLVDKVKSLIHEATFNGSSSKTSTAIRLWKFQSV
jgi:hypothetical protein